jgi:hypothetical protein
MSTGNWYADPTHRHQSRYAEAGQWTEYVADDGSVGSDPLAPVPPQPPRRRRAWPWIVGGLGIALVVLVGAIGLYAVLESQDRYHADLTRGHGDFPTIDNGATARSYQADGFHLVVRDRNTWGMSALRAPTQHTVLGVEVETRPVHMPAGSSFGPFCWQDPTRGYGFVIDADGTRELVQLDGPEGTDAIVLSRVPGTGMSASSSQRLLLTCSISPSPSAGAVHVAGYVNGVKAIDANGRMPLSQFEYTGFAGHTATATPGEWVVSNFWRRGAGDIPR